MSRHSETRASLSGSTGSGGRGKDEAYCATCSRSFSVEASHCPHDGTKLVRFKAQSDTMIGKTLDGRYLIKKPIGEGGMGTVYLGTQISVDREVAIKVVHPTISNEREAAKRFLREARLASRLNAPNIVNVYDFGQSDDGILYLVMELVRGALLGDLLAAMGTIPAPRVVNMAMQLTDALDAAHSLGIVHRDLKPANIICVEDMPGREVVKVLDFGLAKSTTGDSASLAGITSTHSLLGTPLYMAPEMIEGGAVDSRTDFYALGCILYELLTGAPPFNDTAISALFAKHLQELPAPLPPHVPHGLAAVVMRLLAKAPRDRFQSAQELREALFQVATGTPASGTPILRSQHGQLMSPFTRNSPIPSASPAPARQPPQPEPHPRPSTPLPGMPPERNSALAFDGNTNSNARAIPLAWDAGSISHNGPIPGRASTPNTGPVHAPHTAPGQPANHAAISQVIRPSSPGGIPLAVQSHTPRAASRAASGWSGKLVLAIIGAAVVAAIVITAVVAGGGDETPTTPTTPSATPATPPITPIEPAPTPTETTPATSPAATPATKTDTAPATSIDTPPPSDTQTKTDTAQTSSAVQSKSDATQTETETTQTTSGTPQIKSGTHSKTDGKLQTKSGATKSETKAQSKTNGASKAGSKTGTTKQPGTKLDPPGTPKPLPFIKTSDKK